MRARAAVTLALGLTVGATPLAAEPVPPRFNRLVLETVATYRAEGGYVWPARAGTHGTTRDLWLGARPRVIRVARAGRGTHCVGVTFEVLWRSLERLPGGPAAAGLTAASARRMRRIWFVPKDGGMGAAEALPAVRLGRRIASLEDARAGDFVQVWGDGWGHSAVFLGWLRNPTGAIVGLRYWSSQPWTDGMGESSFAIGVAPGEVHPDRIFLARAEPPAARSRRRRR